MRVWGGLAVVLSLCACDPMPGSANAETPVPDNASYDFRYAYRLPTHRIRSVQDSHAAGCDRLGRARCRVTALRYSVADGRVTAALAVKIDPALGRDFGQAATRTVTGAHGVLVDSDLATDDAQSDTMLARLRAALDTAAAAARTGDTLAAAKATRLRGALSALAEIDPEAMSSVATTPMLFTYMSGAPEPTFAAAGPALVESLGGLAVILAGVGPWLLLLIGGALLVRRFVQPRSARDEPDVPLAVPLAVPHTEPEDRSNVIRRWFQRDPENVD